MEGIIRGPPALHGVVTAGSDVFWRQACVLGNPRQYARADFLSIMEGKTKSGQSAL
jgi:hypothetical protein